MKYFIFACFFILFGVGIEKFWNKWSNRFKNIYIYSSELKVLQYFGDNSAATSAFAEVVKVANYSGQWDAELV